MTIFERLLAWVDRRAEGGARRSAQTLGRRSFVSRLGVLLVGTAAVPMLPFDRSGQAHASGPGQSNSKAPEDQTCEYWRNCAIDGYLCSCCGGSLTACPPGTEASKVTWVGTCRNPKDGKNYLINYYDCCGKPSCGRCLCNNNERERPGYRMGVHNDINWCMASTSSAYHCTVSAIVGLG
ncbi:MAG: methylamine dehydrogenase light chain [Burkholderiaceae bacterium]